MPRAVGSRVIDDRLQRPLAGLDEARVSPLALRWIGHRLAALLADAHAAEDDEGVVRPIASGPFDVSHVFVDAEGDLALACGVDDRAPVSATPRGDILALARLVAPRLAADMDPELRAGLALALEPIEARRRITAVELEALFASGADLATGRRELARLASQAPPDPVSALVARASAPLSDGVRLLVALATATLVYRAGLLLFATTRP